MSHVELDVITNVCEIYHNVFK